MEITTILPAQTMIFTVRNITIDIINKLIYVIANSDQVDHKEFVIDINTLFSAMLSSDSTVTTDMIRIQPQPEPIQPDPKIILNQIIQSAIATAFNVDPSTIDDNIL